MNQSILEQITERFPQSKWANPTSAKHKEAMAKLEEFDDEVIVEALDALKRTLARTMVTPDQLIAEIKMLRKRTAKVVKDQNEEILTAQVEHDRAEMLNELLAAPVQSIASAVKYLRKVGVFAQQPLSRDIKSWSPFTIGMVWAAVESKQKEIA